MKTIEQIVKAAGKEFTDPELHLKIENSPYMSLTIEAIGKGPRGYPAISICHYGEQNGDLMRDPEMCFEIVQVPTSPYNKTPKWQFFPYYWRNDYAGVEQTSVFVDSAGRLMAQPTRVKQHTSFAAMWNKNLKEQGFVEAAKRLKI